MFMAVFTHQASAMCMQHIFPLILTGDSIHTTCVSRTTLFLRLASWWKQANKKILAFLIPLYVMNTALENLFQRIQSNITLNKNTGLKKHKAVGRKRDKKRNKKRSERGCTLGIFIWMLTWTERHIVLLNRRSADFHNRESGVKIDAFTESMNYPGVSRWESSAFSHV